MQIKTGHEIVRLHSDYEEKIRELENSVIALQGYGYTQKVLEEKLENLKFEMQLLEGTRFQPLEPTTIVNSMLGGTTDDRSYN